MHLVLAPFLVYTPAVQLVKSKEHTSGSGTLPLLHRSCSVDQQAWTNKLGAWIMFRINKHRSTSKASIVINKHGQQAVKHGSQAVKQCTSGSPASLALTLLSAPACIVSPHLPPGSPAELLWWPFGRLKPASHPHCLRLHQRRESRAYMNRKRWDRIL
eukprot:1140695-Pelagomonas_calceolata.AAC.5